MQRSEDTFPFLIPEKTSVILHDQGVAELDSETQPELVCGDSQALYPRLFQEVSV